MPVFYMDSDLGIDVFQEPHSARASFDHARLNLVTALSKVESTKRFEFLEAVIGTMEASPHYIKQARKMGGEIKVVEKGSGTLMQLYLVFNAPAESMDQINLAL